MKYPALVITVIVAITIESFLGTKAQQAGQPVAFEIVSAEKSGITWRHDNGRSETRHLPETCGGGGAFFDYNNDGWI